MNTFLLPTKSAIPESIGMSNDTITNAAAVVKVIRQPLIIK